MARHNWTDDLSGPSTRVKRLEAAVRQVLRKTDANKLERKYRDSVGKEPPEPKPAAFELPTEFQNLDMGRALKVSLERERDSESYFRFLAERVPDTSDLGKLFMELAEIEWKHKSDLQAEYDATVADPEQFLLDI